MNYMRIDFKTFVVIHKKVDVYVLMCVLKDVNCHLLVNP